MCSLHRIHTDGRVSKGCSEEGRASGLGGPGPTGLGSAFQCHSSSVKAIHLLAQFSIHLGSKDMCECQTRRPTLPSPLDPRYECQTCRDPGFNLCEACWDRMVAGEKLHDKEGHAFKTVYPREAQVCAARPREAREGSEGARGDCLVPLAAVAPSVTEWHF